MIIIIMVLIINNYKPVPLSHSCHLLVETNKSRSAAAIPAVTQLS